jgi:hypothetical protein
VKPGDSKILAKRKLATGSEIYVVAHRTSDIIDAFEVSCYKKDSTNLTEYFIGHEEPFWWGCYFREEPKSNALIIQALGREMARFSLLHNYVYWKDNVHPVSFPVPLYHSNVAQMILKDDKR